MPIENLLILTDEQLVLMAREGSETAEEILIEKYKGLVRAKAKAYFIAGAEAEDVVQEGMIGLMKAVRSFDEGREASFKTYAGTCINNQILKAIRKAEREKNQPLNDAISLDNHLGEKDENLTIGDILKASMFDEPEEKVIYEDTLLRLKGLSRNIFSPLEAQVLRAKIAGKNYQEIAEELGKSPKTIDNALQRIRKKIMAFLEM
ncbi:MAG: sigma-70 family RNA polymerase sigma factor [Firmicutes bacterium]|nr:sigma-70 family RNA polymerase sigma factor [Clostridiales bacterium]MBR3184260.1 sigma-70 family RNA polymerase sigma factor [Bacillota bacterium]MBR3374935.1 sigma-70 family RNA polymerase sigma factor [Bacillota bacterium]MBR4024156.1 sigma-70 family RNA polymerase sigma factor [Bacillota bacterium]MBR6224969.1 sigma-70 family RNA polymerase sigma factor [Bacillota bacterium]